MQRPTRSPTLSGSFASLPLQALNDGIQNQTAAWFRLDVGIRVAYIREHLESEQFHIIPQKNDKIDDKQFGRFF